MLLFCQLPTTTTSTTTTTEAITTTTFSIDQLVTTPADISDVKTAVGDLYVYKNTVP